MSVDPSDPDSVSADLAAPGGDLRGTAVRSVGWTAFAQLGNQAIQITASIIITRLLVPKDFGLSGMILVFFGLATLLSDFGLYQALVQRPDLRREHLSTAFWSQATLGTSAMALGIATAPLIASFYDEPRLRPIAMAMAPGFLLSALGTVPQALLARRFQFRALAIGRIVTTLLASGTAVVIAAAGGGVWSFVGLSLVTAGGASAAAWLMSGWRPDLAIEGRALRELTGYGSRVFGSSLMTYGTQNLDNLLIGRTLGPATLGLYVRSFSLVLTPSRQVTATIGQVMFSTLARVGDQRDRTKRIYLRTIAALSFLTFPTMIGLAIVTDDFVRTAFGPDWVPAITVMRIFCVIGAIAPLAGTIGWIYQSQGRADLLLRWGIWAGGVYMASIVVGALFGSMEAVAIAVAVNYLVLLYPGFALPGRLIGMSFFDVCRATAGPSAATFVMALAVLAVNESMDAASSPIRLLAQTATGAVVYAALVHFGRVPAYRDLREVILEQLKKRSAGTDADPAPTEASD